MALIKLKVKEQSSRGSLSKLIMDNFVDACIKLDTSLIEPLMNEDSYFEEKDKWAFLAFLKGQFEAAKVTGLERTILKQGRCKMCVIGHSTHEFYGEDGKIRFAYIIQKVDNEIKDIYNCNASSGWLTNDND